MSRWKLDIENGGSRIKAGHDWLGRAVLNVNGRSIAGSFFDRFKTYVKARDLRPVLTLEFEARGRLFDLALYIGTSNFSQEWVLMDGDDVIAATHPTKLPSSRRPGARA